MGSPPPRPLAVETISGLRWQIGEKLYLEGETAKAAMAQQESHREQNAKEGIIREFISRKVPADWGRRSIQQRKMFWANEFGSADESALVERTRVCALEIWVECFGGDVRYMKKSDAREINDILSRAEGWERMPSPSAVFGAGYGQQRGYKNMLHSQ